MIEEYKKLIEDELEKYFDELFLCKEHKYAQKTIEAMKYTTCLKGKRLRGILCLEASRLVCNDYKRALAASSALEMLHAQSLIHDDLPCMDNDDLRRGKPSNHKVFGEAIAVLAGDALISFGAETIIKKTPVEVPKQNVLEAVSKYLEAAGIFGIVGGQTADMEAEKSDSKLREDENLIQYIHNYKTGALFRASVLIGAILGGAKDEEKNALDEFAKSFGLSFQIADDILDVISTTEEMGKTTGKDENENKLTFVKKYGLEGAKEKLNSKLEETCGILSKSGFKSKVLSDIIYSIENKIN